ncbi:MAG: YCF48-related protein [Chitinophagaceae bacterium]
MPMRFVLVCIAFFMGQITRAQRIEMVTEQGKCSIRGMSVVSDNIVWVSGSNGTVGRTVDGGKTWTWMQVKGHEKNDFRDIEAFDEKTAIIMAVGEPAFILKTFNGGSTWKRVYEDSSKGMFLDAMEFWENGNGIVVGDPIDNKIYVARTADYGVSWERYNTKSLPATDSGEAMFASSGTNIRKYSSQEAMVVTGGKRSRLLMHERWVDIPMLQGGNSTGANSLAVWNEAPRKARIVIVGGDFQQDSSTVGNCVYSTNGGRTWKIPEVPPHGYRSCVEFLTGQMLVACGTSGVDISMDGGKKWRLVSKESFHVCQRAKTGNVVYLAGSRGRIAKLVGY